MKYWAHPSGAGDILLLLCSWNGSFSTKVGSGLKIEPFKFDVKHQNFLEKNVFFFLSSDIFISRIEKKR